MRATIMYRAEDVRVENVPDAKIEQPTDALVRVTHACTCGSDLWPYHDLPPTEGGRQIGHEATWLLIISRYLAIFLRGVDDRLNGVCRVTRKGLPRRQEGAVYPWTSLKCDRVSQVLWKMNWKLHFLRDDEFDFDSLRLQQLQHPFWLTIQQRLNNNTKG